MLKGIVCIWKNIIFMQLANLLHVQNYGSKLPVSTGILFVMLPFKSPFKNLFMIKCQRG